MLAKSSSATKRHHLDLCDDHLLRLLAMRSQMFVGDASRLLDYLASPQASTQQLRDQQDQRHTPRLGQGGAPAGHGGPRGRRSTPDRDAVAALEAASGIILRLADGPRRFTPASTLSVRPA